MGAARSHRGHRPALRPPPVPDAPEPKLGPSQTPGPTKPHPAIARPIVATERQAEALEARKLGWSYRRIGDHLGISRQAANMLVTRALDELAAEVGERAEQVRRLSLERLDIAVTGLMPAVGEGDPRAVIAMVKVEERRARLLGLDAPRTIGFGPSGDEPVKFVIEMSTPQRPVPQLEGGAP